jgi:hypothetical protein
MKINYPLLAFVCLSTLPFFSGYAQSVKVIGPAGSEKFGNHVKALDNGNYVVADPYYDEGSTADVGAVFLYHGFTHLLISKLTGSSTNDRIGLDGISPIAGNKFVIRSSAWSNGSIADAGAVTVVDGSIGLTGVVSATNSLVGSWVGDKVGSKEIIDLKNGNYLVHSPFWANGPALNAGAVTWFSGSAGISGVISSSNSITGSKTNDHIGTNVGSDLITVLDNGNYVIASPFWDNGSISDAGAVTLCVGSSGTSGTVNALNSLTGSSTNDKVGIGGIVKLSNGNFVVSSYLWNNGSAFEAGASTWATSGGSLTGVVGAHNSLVGGSSQDLVGMTCTALTNGNYLVVSSFWNSITANDVGAVTWANGSLGITGLVSPTNSLVGTKANDQVGNGCQLVLSNGNYVIGSQDWDHGEIVNAGAATWGNGTTGITGAVSSLNSLVGSSVNDRVGIGGLSGGAALSNGNYVLCSSTWNNGSVQDAGFAAWGDGTVGLKGSISSANALVGTVTDDKVGENGVLPLGNGAYIIRSPHWNNGPNESVGAVTWGDGLSTLSGAIGPANSLVGSRANDLAGNNGITVLNNGNYLVQSASWDNGSVENVGAITWGSKASGVKGEITAANSLIGSTSGDYLGMSKPVPLSNGDFIIVASNFSNPSTANIGAVSLLKGDAEVTGYFNDKDLITGVTANDYVGYGSVQIFPNDIFLINSPYFDNASIAQAGALTWGTGATMLSGVVNACNSIIGQVANGIPYDTRSVYNPKYNYILVGLKNENTLVVFDPTDVSLADDQHEAEIDLARPGTTALIDKDNCALIANLSSAGSNPVLGLVEAKVWLEDEVLTHNGAPYVARHTQITPETNPSSASGTITLYFTKKEFDDFNAHNGSDFNLPSDANDDSGKANLRIRKFSGKSGDGSGRPESYASEGSTVIDPDNDKIVWNPNLSRWEVTFNVTGFSGFIVQADNTSLPVRLVSFEGKGVESSSILTWKIADAVNFSHFEVERSLDGKNFVSLGSVSADGEDVTFNYTDKGALIFGDQETVK